MGQEGLLGQQGESIAEGKGWSPETQQLRDSHAGVASPQISLPEGRVPLEGTAA